MTLEEVHDLLDSLEATVYVRGGKLIVSPAGVLTPELRAGMREHQEALLRTAPERTFLADVLAEFSGATVVEELPLTRRERKDWQVEVHKGHPSLFQE